MGFLTDWKVKPEIGILVMKYLLALTSLASFAFHCESLTASGLDDNKSLISFMIEAEAKWSESIRDQPGKGISGDLPIGAFIFIFIVGWCRS